jgi:hypothetical protein
MTDRTQPEDRDSAPEEFDATGTARYAAAREELAVEPNTAGPAEAAVGLTDHMGESPSSPGLAGDLRADRDPETGEDGR